MTVVIEPKLETRLHTAAAQTGQAPDDYLNALLDNALPKASGEFTVAEKASLTLADVFAGRIGGTRGDGTSYSTDTGLRYTEALNEKYASRRRSDDAASE